jgi:hypothetical protein
MAADMEETNMIRTICLGVCALFAAMASMPASAQQQKPNILFIMGDDVG